MKQALAVLAILTMAAFASQIRVDLPGGSGSYDVDVLQYDDGSPTGSPGAAPTGELVQHRRLPSRQPGFLLQQMEYWFFEHSSYPGTPPSSTARSGTATTWFPWCFLPGSGQRPPLRSLLPQPRPRPGLRANFWGLINTTMSAGGWPSVLGDNTVGEHSFFSDDMIVWEPWGELGDYFIRAKGEFNSLNSTTWGAVKALF